MNNLRKEFGKKLRAKRKANNLSLKQLAEKIDISYVAICSYENGSKSPTFENLVKLCQFFKVSLEYFINPNIDDNKLNEEYQAIFYLAKKRNVTAKTLENIINAIYPDDIETIVCDTTGVSQNIDEDSEASHTPEDSQNSD